MLGRKSGDAKQQGEMPSRLKALVEQSQQFCGHSSLRRSIVRGVLIGLMTLALVVGLVPAALGQLGQLPSIPSPAALPQSSQSPPAGVERLGNIEVTPVSLENQRLFMIASPTVWDRSKPGQIPVEVRSQQIEANLNRVIQIRSDDIQISLQQGIRSSTAYDPKTLQVYVAALNRATTIVVKDKNHPLPLQLLTVTQADAEYEGMPIDRLADSMRTTIDQRLHEALLERSTLRLGDQVVKAVLIALGTIGGSLVLWLCRKLLCARDNSLKARQTTEAAESKQAFDQTTSEGNPSVQRLTALNARQRRSRLDRRRSAIALLQWLVFWGQVVLLGGGVLLILSLFPWTKPLSWDILSVPLKLLGIWFAVGFTNRLGDTSLTLLEKFWGRYHLLATEDGQRESLRIVTAISALKGLKIALVYLFALILGLGILGAPLSSILAVSGLIVVALSLSFQNLARDLVTGSLILWEDQFAIGDVIAIQNTAGKISTGLVENLNLRITQLRNNEGRLITIPNSTITQVENLTRSWSRVDFAIEVAYDTDVDRAIAAIQEAAQQMYAEAEWQAQIMEPPDVLGVDALSHTGMLIRAWIKTKPAQQWRVGREFRRRVRVALEQHNIAIGKPQQVSWDKLDSAVMNGVEKQEVQ